MEAALCLSDISVHETVECFKMKCLRYKIKARKQNNNRETKGKLIVAEQKNKTKTNLEINS